MKLIFRLRFQTAYGQSLLVTGNHPLLGNGRVEDAVPLEYLDRDHWQVAISAGSDSAPDSTIQYDYILREKDGSLTRDWGKVRELNPAAFGREEVLMIDTWNPPGAIENAFFTEPFQQTLLKTDRAAVESPEVSDATHTFKVRAPLLTKDQTLCLLGDADALGHWNTSAPLLLARTGGSGFFSARLNLGNQSFPIAYKYGVYDTAGKTFVGYEGGENRGLNAPAAPGRQTVVDDGFAALPATTWKGAGVAIPVFSLRSDSSFGVGEFTDLKLLADWGQRAGLKLIQLLPINDTTATHTWKDSYPYSAISAFALHPLYLNLSQMAEGSNRALLRKLEQERRRLNSLEDLDYQDVIRAKFKFIDEIFPSQRDKTFRSADYRDFFKRNRHWLVPYAAFCYLRDKHGTADFNQWPEHRRFDANAIAELSAEGSPAYEKLAVNYFIQYHLHVQLREAAQYIHAKGIILKGDLAIGVFRWGADAWGAPELFHMEFQAGAPPDPFADKGQNWSFPTYNWPRMKQDGYAWWTRRFEQMGTYFDAFRVDHILGFFRIWSIPWEAVEGILGHFVPVIPLDADEFRNRGIGFDHARYTQPFLTSEIVRQIFKGDEGAVRKKFLESAGQGTYALKPEYATQRQIEGHFAGQEQNERNARIKQGLYDAIANVILLEAEGSGGRKYHFRFFIDHTHSFKALPAQTREQLMELYVDYFWRRQDDFWRKQAMEKLPALKRVTNMLVCGEDLGMVPECVPGVMKELGLLSLEVQRMPKSAGHDFSRPKDAPYLSVVTPSTHDMSTIRGWWEEDEAVRQQFYNQELQQEGKAPTHCEAWINRAIVQQHLDSPAMWSIFQLQDLMGMDEKLRRDNAAAERINIPAKAQYYWRYRMHLTLETLLNADGFNRELKGLIQRAGR